MRGGACARMQVPRRGCLQPPHGTIHKRARCKCFQAAQKKGERRLKVVLVLVWGKGSKTSHDTPNQAGVFVFGPAGWREGGKRGEA